MRVLLASVLVALAFAPTAGAWSWPTDGDVLKPFAFDESHPYAAGQHRGIDIAGSAGGPVVAPASGTVSFAGTVPTNGKTVTIQAAGGYAVTLVHLGSYSVSKGASVMEGAPVGTIGPSGVSDETVPYVYLGMRIASDPQGYVDPLTLLPARTPPPPAASDPSAQSVPASTGETDSSSTAAAPQPDATPESAPAVTDPTPDSQPVQVPVVSTGSTDPADQATDPAFSGDQASDQPADSATTAADQVDNPADQVDNPVDPVPAFTVAGQVQASGTPDPTTVSAGSDGAGVTDTPVTGDGSSSSVDEPNPSDGLATEPSADASSQPADTSSQPVDASSASAQTDSSVTDPSGSDAGSSGASGDTPAADPLQPQTAPAPEASDQASASEPATQTQASSEPPPTQGAETTSYSGGGDERNPVDPASPSTLAGGCSSRRRLPLHLRASSCRRAEERTPTASIRRGPILMPGRFRRDTARPSAIRPVAGTSAGRSRRIRLSPPRLGHRPNWAAHPRR